jgi:hypothetical protein
MLSAYFKAARMHHIAVLLLQCYHCIAHTLCFQLLALCLATSATSTSELCNMLQSPNNFLQRRFLKELSSKKSSLPTPYRGSLVVVCTWYCLSSVNCAAEGSATGSCARRVHSLLLFLPSSSCAMICPRSPVRQLKRIASPRRDLSGEKVSAQSARSAPCSTDKLFVCVD